MEAQGQSASHNPLHEGGTPQRKECWQGGGVNNLDPDGIEGVTEEFIVCLTRAVKDAQQMEKHC